MTVAIHGRIIIEVEFLQHCSVVRWLVTRETAAVSAHGMFTAYNNTPVSSVTLFEATYAGCMCVAVTCHLHFWQNERDLLDATAVTRGWDGYRNKSQHRKLSLEKEFLPPLLPGLEPETFGT